MVARRDGGERVIGHFSLLFIPLEFFSHTNTRSLRISHSVSAFVPAAIIQYISDLTHCSRVCTHPYQSPQHLTPHFQYNPTDEKKNPVQTPMYSLPPRNELYARASHSTSPI